MLRQELIALEGDLTSAHVPWQTFDYKIFFQEINIETRFKAKDQESLAFSRELEKITSRKVLQIYYRNKLILISSI